MACYRDQGAPDEGIFLVKDYGISENDSSLGGCSTTKLIEFIDASITKE